MASPLEEASRATVVGRKRKHPAELWAAYDVPTNHGDKRQRLADNNDYMPLDDSGESSKYVSSHSLSESDSAQSTRRGSRESGKVLSSVASDDERGYSPMPMEKPRVEQALPMRTRATANCETSRKTPCDVGQDGAPLSKAPSGNGQGISASTGVKTLTDIDHLGLRERIRFHAQARPMVSIISLVKECCAPGKPMRSHARAQLRLWEDPTYHIVYDKSLQPVEMTWNDVPKSSYNGMRKSAKALCNQGMGSIAQVLASFAESGTFAKQAQQCLLEFDCKRAASQADALPAEQRGVGVRRSARLAKGAGNVDPGLTPANGLEGQKKSHSAKTANDDEIPPTATQQPEVPETTTLELDGLVRLYTDPAIFTRAIMMDDVDPKKLKNKMTRLQAKYPDATCAQLLLDLAITPVSQHKKNVLRAHAERKLCNFANKYLVKSAVEVFNTGDRDSRRKRPNKAQRNAGHAAGLEDAGPVQVASTAAVVESRGEHRAPQYTKAQYVDLTLSDVEIDVEVEEEKGEPVPASNQYKAPEQSREEPVGPVQVASTAAVVESRGEHRAPQYTKAQYVDLTMSDDIVEVEAEKEEDMSEGEVRDDDDASVGDEPEKEVHLSEGEVREDDDAIVGDAPNGPSHDYGALARSAAFTDILDHPGAPDALTKIRLGELTNEEQKLQYRYFHIIDLEATVRCLMCGTKGHMSDNCPGRTCDYCQEVDGHFSHACPLRRKCSHCRKRGHDLEHCTFPSAKASGHRDICERCGEINIEDNCDCSWSRSINLGKVAGEGVWKIPSWQMWVACYKCGSSKHWGDDCRHLSRSARMNLGPSVWSAAHAEQFVDRNAKRKYESDEDSEGSVGDGGYRGEKRGYEKRRYEDSEGSAEDGGYGREQRADEKKADENSKVSAVDGGCRGGAYQLAQFEDELDCGGGNW
ncbi:hypothetical protein LTR08_003053 [Meristemomyces frigidus]|nr:hypothetical protein LTR08_003053 [Meristemomyces frigidus]